MGRTGQGAPRDRVVLVSNRQRKVPLDVGRVRGVADFALGCLGLGPVELSVVLVSDRGIRPLNRLYLGRDRVTDVLAFPQAGTGKGALPHGWLGDVVINAETAARRAGGDPGGLNRELDLLLVHGILHLVGYDHTGGAAEAAEMRRRQRNLLRRIRRRFPVHGTCDA